MAEYISVRLVRPAIFTITAIICAGLLIYGIGHLLLAVYEPDFSKEYDRKELWVGVGLALLILGVASFLATRPAGALGPLDDEVAIGSKPMSGVYDLTPVDPYARFGALGSVDDVAAGYTLYARNGALAEVTDVLQSVEDIGEKTRTLLFSRGLSGAPDEIWIPIEAVTSVYPETRSAFLAIAGDEVEALGWNVPPASFARVERPKETPLY